ncbi:unnamed protein product [Litomosoides sigmodontis]|uniref:Uncharacterized protein n=1 Tax=Litomosoides sigmodontis TaxID=42156 RepID=A0A3P6TGV9_LITSI|nr:unnamed protein product [Litomosoides sigmodontis]
MKVLAKPLEYSSRRVKNTIGRTFVETTGSEEMLSESDQLMQAFATVSGSAGASRSDRRKQLAQHRFTVNDILSPLDNIGL